MKLPLLFSVAPLVLAWPPPHEQSSSGTAAAVRGDSEFAKRDASPFFYVWPGKPKKGGCDDWIDKINPAYDQAVDMAVKARDALEFLKSAKPNSGDDASKDDFNNALKWDKYQKSLKDLFNIEVDAHRAPTEEMKENIKKVQDVFELIAKNKDAQGEEKDKDKPKLICGEKGIGIAQDGDKIDPDNDKEKPAGKYGAWVWPGRESKSSKKNIPFKKYNRKGYEKDIDHPCKGGGAGTALGYTPSRTNTIFLCDGGLKLDATVHTPQEGKSLVDTLQKARSISDTLLHEMLHLFAGFDDVEKVKFPPKQEKTADEPLWKDEANRIPERHKLTYGYLASYHLARYVGVDTLKTPETFVWFAISILHEDWKFEGKEGVAEKIAWKK